MMAWFAIPNQEDDPLVSYFFEGTTKEPEIGMKFSEFMGKDLMGNAKLFAAEKRFNRTRKRWWRLWK